MFDKIICHPDISVFVRRACHENGICIEICDELLIEGDELNDDLINILKIDEYYNSLHIARPPPSIDCLVILKTGENEFGFLLVELRNVTGTKLIKPRDILPKFKTTINDFMSNRFSDVFLDESFQVSFFKLWLVTDPFKIACISDEQYEKKIKGTVLEQYNGIKPLKFRDKVAMITPKPPSEIICI